MYKTQGGERGLFRYIYRGSRRKTKQNNGVKKVEKTIIGGAKVLGNICEYFRLCGNNVRLGISQFRVPNNRYKYPIVAINKKEKFTIVQMNVLSVSAVYGGKIF